MFMPDVLADLTKCVSEQRAVKKGLRAMNSRRSFDHLVGHRKQLVGDIDTEGPSLHSG